MNKIPVKGDFEYKRELAHQLIKRFGIRSAEQTCVENKWEEVLRAVKMIVAH